MVKQLIVTFLLVIATMVVFRIFVKRGYREKGGLTPLTIFLQLLIFFLHGFSSYTFINIRGNKIVGDNFFEIVGITFMVIGGSITLIGMINLGIKKTFGKKSKDLKQTGFYKYSRNPQIVFYLMFIAGYALIYPGWAALLWIGTLLFMCHIMVITEEEHLLRTFKGEYKEYCKRTPRYIKAL